MDLAVFVHDPGHGLGVGAQIGGGDVAIGAQDVLNVLGIAPGNRIKLPFAERQGIQLDATLGAPEWQVEQRGLPGHQHGQSADFVLVGHGVVAKAALVGAAGAVVLDAVAVEHLDAPVVHADRQRHPHVSPGLLQHAAGPGIQAQP